MQEMTGSVWVFVSFRVVNVCVQCVGVGVCVSSLTKALQKERPLVVVLNHTESLWWYISVEVIDQHRRIYTLLCEAVSHKPQPEMGKQPSEVPLPFQGTMSSLYYSSCTCSESFAWG